MTEGDPNVRVRSDGQRVCRACEAEINFQRYQNTKRARAGIIRPFTLAHLRYDDLRTYESTQIGVLAQYVEWQRATLAKVETMAGKQVKMPDDSSMPADIIAEILKTEIPVVEAIVKRRALEELAKGEVKA
jgi:hypothetical protein